MIVCSMVSSAMDTPTAITVQRVERLNPRAVRVRSTRERMRICGPTCPAAF